MGIKLAIIDEEGTELWSATESEIKETLDNFGSLGLGSWIEDEIKQASNLEY